MPRTTLDLDAHVLRELKRRKRTSGRSIGQIASELLPAALHQRGKRPEPTPKRVFAWRSARMGARVNLHDEEAVARALERR